MDDMNITLKQLRAFVAIAHTENVSRAATQLSLTQSAVSTALGELEQQLGLTLFDRTGKRIRINPQGHWLLPKAQRILDQVGSIAEELGQAGHQSLSLGASTTIADFLFPRLARHLYGQFPELELQLESGNSSAILSELLTHRIELGLVEGICQHPKITSTPWWTDRLVIVANPNHPLTVKAVNGPLSSEALKGSQWIMREAGSGTRAIFEHAFRALLPHFDILTELKHVPTIKALVANGDALACLSEITVAKELATGELAVLDIQGMALERQFYILQHKEAFQSEIHLHLIRWIMQQSKERKEKTPPVTGE
jgi:DNA-binding transcriptional LysR family regulator